MPRAASSFSFAFTSSSSPSPPTPQQHRPPPSFFRLPHLSFPPPSPPPPGFLSIHHPRERSSSVPQYVTTTRHTLLAGAQDNCPHYSYLKSAPHARERTSARARARALAASSDAIAPRYKDAAERELIAGDGGGWRKMCRRSRDRAPRRSQLLISASGGRSLFCFGNL